MAKEAKKEAPDTSKDESFLRAFGQLVNQVGDMILEPIEEAVKEIVKPGKEGKTNEVESDGRAERKVDSNGNGSAGQSITLNLGSLFKQDKPGKPKRTAAPPEEKGKAPGEQESDDDTGE